MIKFLMPIDVNIEKYFKKLDINIKELSKDEIYKVYEVTEEIFKELSKELEIKNIWNNCSWEYKEDNIVGNPLTEFIIDGKKIIAISSKKIQVSCKNFLESKNIESSKILETSSRAHEKLLLKEWADKLNNRQYGNEVTQEEIKELKKLGLVIIYGNSDDLAEIEGAFFEELGCYDRGKFIYVKEAKKFVDINYYKRNPYELIKIDLEQRPAINIKCNNGYWEYNLPEEIINEEFHILEEERLYGIGKIFYAKDFF